MAGGRMSTSKHALSNALHGPRAVIEEKNLRTEVRWAGDNAERFQQYARELVDSAPDVILASASPSLKSCCVAAGSRQASDEPSTYRIDYIRKNDWHPTSDRHPT